MTMTQQVGVPRQLAHGAIRVALRVSSWVAISTGFLIMFFPVNGFGASQPLIDAKLISVLGGLAMTVALGLGLFLMGMWLRRTLILQQKRNDDTAERILSELRSNPDAPAGDFYLYLRAFETTGQLDVPLYLRLRKLSLGMRRLETSDLESHVSNAVRRVAPMIALGRPGEAIGAGRVITEEKNWETDVVTLMKRAKGIFVVPSSRPGTLWETGILKREGLLQRKVVFIMPPRTRGDLDTKERWEVARQTMATHGLELPEFQPRGLLFEVGVDGRVANVEPLLLNSARQVRKSLKRLLSAAPPRGGLYESIAVANRRARRATFWGWLGTVQLLSPFALATLAPFAGDASVGFNPDDSWKTVGERTETAEIIDRHAAFEADALAKSERYLAMAAGVPPEGIAGLRAGLLGRGLRRLDDDLVSAYFAALGDMLGRVDEATCAVIARGEVEQARMQVALTYIAPERIRGFLNARTNAILAEVEEAPVPSRDQRAVAMAAVLARINMSREGQGRYERIQQVQGRLSDADHCWLVRAMYSSAGTLNQPHAGTWARTLAERLLQEDTSSRRNRE